MRGKTICKLRNQKNGIKSLFLSGFCLYAKSVFFMISVSSLTYGLVTNVLKTNQKRIFYDAL